MVNMDGTVESVGLFDRQEKGIFQIEASHEDHFILAPKAHRTYSHSVVVNIEIFPTSLKKSGIDSDTTSFTLIFEPNCQILN